MSLGSGGAARVLAAGVLLTACTACSSAKQGQPSARGGAGGAPAAGASAEDAGHGGAAAAANGNGVSGSPNGGADAADAGSGASAGSDSNAACGTETSAARPVPFDLLILLDASASMLDMSSAQSTKWDAVKGALEAFLQADASAGIGVGLQYFPVLKPNTPASCTNNAECGESGPCALKYCFNSDNGIPCEVETDCSTTAGGSTGPCVPFAFCSKNPDYLCANPGSACQALNASQDLGTCQQTAAGYCEHPTSCDVAQYSVPAVAIAPLPDAAAGLIASIDGKQPSGDTPTGPALSGALQQAATWATGHRDHRVATVLVTDGLPTDCSPSTFDALAALAKAGSTGSPSVDTFVIGVFGAQDVTTNAPENVDQIAQQGGTDHAFIVDTQADVTAQVSAALEAIRNTRPECQFLAPPSPSGGALDAGMVNVTLTTPTQDRVVQRVSGAGACDPVAGGWYYELGGGTPSHIVACPVTCSAISGGGASVSLVVGCPTTGP